MAETSDARYAVQRFSYIGVELGPGAPRDFEHRIQGGPRPLVRAFMRDHVKGIGDRYDAGVERNVMLLQTARIAGAIEVFVVSENGFGGARQRRRTPYIATRLEKSRDGSERLVIVAAGASLQRDRSPMSRR